MKKLTIVLFLIVLVAGSKDCEAQNFKKSRVVVEPTLLWCNQFGYVKTNANGKKVCDCERVDSESMLFRTVENDLISKFKAANWSAMSYLDVAREEELNEAKRLAQGTQQSDFDLATKGPVVDYAIRFDFPSAPTPDGARIGFEYISMTYSIVEMATSAKIASGSLRSVSTSRGYYDLEKMVLNCIETEFPNIEAQLRAARDEKESNGRETRIEFSIEGDFDMYEPCGNGYLSEVISNYMNSISFNGESNPEEGGDFYLSFRPMVPPDVDQIKPWLMGQGESSLMSVLKACNLMPKPSNKGTAINVKIVRMN
jgi:hypothetical protein